MTTPKKPAKPKPPEKFVNLFHAGIKRPPKWTVSGTTIDVPARPSHYFGKDPV
jgi:hypothetical protein